MGVYWENIKKIQICYRFILQGRSVKPYFCQRESLWRAQMCDTIVILLVATLSQNNYLARRWRYGISDEKQSITKGCGKR